MGRCGRVAPLGSRIARRRGGGRAVDLLANGRHVRPGAAWVRPCARPGWYWLDADALASYAATRTGDERRVLTLAARLVDGDPWTRRRVVNPGRAADERMGRPEPGQVVYLVGALIVSVAVGVAVWWRSGPVRSGPVEVKRSGSQRSGRPCCRTATRWAGRQGPVMMGLSTGRDEPAAFVRPEVIRVSSGWSWRCGWPGSSPG